MENQVRELKEKLEKYNSKNPTKEYSYSDGLSIGYIKGQLNILENILGKKENFNISKEENEINIKTKKIPKEEDIQNLLKKTGLGARKK